MYNEEIKQRYIEFKTNATIVSNGYLENLFLKTEEREVSFNKDICNFTTYEITEFYKFLNISIFESLLVLNSNLALYTDWCIIQGISVDNQNHFKEIDREIISKCLNKALINKKIVARENILSWCNQLPNASDKFLFLATFEIGKNRFYDLSQVRISDISEDNHLMLLGEGSVNISQRLVEFAAEANDENVYYSLSANNVRKKLIPSDTIVKNIMQQNSDKLRCERNLYIRIKRMIEYLGKSEYLSIIDISNSGKIHMINENAKRLQINGEQYLRKYYIEVEHQYSCKIDVKNYIRKYGDYLI